LTDRPNRIAPFALLAGALLLAGCGVRGPLEPPVGTENIASPNPLQTSITPDSPGTSVTSTPTQTATSKSFSTPVGKKDEGKKKKFRQGGVPTTGPAEKPDRPFVLDKLL